MKRPVLGGSRLVQRWSRLARWYLAALGALLGAKCASAQTWGISTLAGGGTTTVFNTPEGVTVDGAGNIYVADTLNNRVRKVTSAGVVSTLASTGFNGLAGVAVDSSGNVFVADTLNHVIRKVDSGGTVTVIAGSAGASGVSVASASLTAARFNSPQGVATNGAGTILYVADTGNQVIRRIDIGGDAVTTIAGTQGSAGTGAAQFNFPSAVAFSGTLLYVADRENHAIRKIDLANSNALTTFAGTLGTSGSTNSPALFFRPRGIAIDGSGNLFVADYSNNTIRHITSGGTVSTIAGTAGTSGVLLDGIGAAARFNGPWGIAVDGSGNIYIGDSNNHAVRKGSPASAPTAFSTQPGPATFTIGASSTVTFTVAANGSPAPSYQWQRAPASNPTAFANLSNGTANGLTVSGATTATLTISGAAVTNNGDQFRAVASNIVGSLNSNGATLTVNQQPTITSANNTTFVVDTAGSFTVTATGSPAPTFSVISGTFPSNWANQSAFESTGVISGTPPNTSGSPFNFTIQASNGVGTAATQAFTLTVSSTVPPVINTQPSNYTVPAGQTTATFSVSASGTPAVTSYQWERQAGGIGAFVAVTDGVPAGVAYTGKTSATLSITGVNSMMNGDVFRVVVSNGATTTSNGATLLVPPTFTNVTSTAFVVNQDHSFLIQASGSPAPTITHVGGTLPTGVEFTPGAGMATLSGTPTDQGTFFLSFAATNSGGTRAQTLTLTVQQPQAPTITSPSSATFTLNQPGSFTFTASGAPAAEFTLFGASLPPGLQFISPVLSGTPTSADNSPITLSVIATNSTGTSPTQTFTLTIVGSPPTITGEPSSVTANIGGSVTFTASASGTPTPTIRWQRQPSGTSGFVNLTESSTYVGTQSTTLTVNNIDAFMSGDQFRIVATNNNNVTATSTAATLTVNIGTAFTTVAGSPQFFGSVDGTGSAARFNSPTGIAVDFSGNVYIADTANHVIRKMTPGGVVTTIAGQAGISGTADGVGSTARFNSPQAVAVDAVGNVYVADTFNHTIRAISAGGIVSTIAGAPGINGAVDAVGSEARFFLPSGIVLDNALNLYVADTSNHAIRRVALANGSVSTFAGLMGSSGLNNNVVGTSARFNAPVALARDSSGNLYVADSLNHIIRKIGPSADVSTLAGIAGSAGFLDGNAATARFNRPTGVAVDSSGNVYVADNLSSTLRKITALGETTTLAGSPGSIGTADGVGGQARFNQPVGVAVDFSGNVYVTDTRNHTIRRSGSALPPEITTQPANRTAPLGGSVTFTVAATGAPAPGYQWQRQSASSPGFFFNLANDANFSGVNTASLTLTNVDATMHGDQFRVVVSNGVPNPAISEAATLTIGVVPVFTSAAAATFQAGGLRTFNVTVDSDPAATFSLSGQPSWLSINPSTGVLSGNPPDTSGSPHTFTITANNGISATQTFVLTVTPAVVPPVIVTHPTGGLINQGDTASFSVSATGTAPLSYQWRRDGVAINGATNSTLVINNVQASAAGSYSVVVSNAVGSATSNAATLVINTPPIFVSQPHPQIALAGGNVTFSVSATGGAGLGYQWRRNGVAIPGATNATLTVNNVSAADAGNYDVQVSNAFGLFRSSLAQLTITTGPTAPVVVSQPATRTVLVGSSTVLSVAATGAPSPTYQWRKNGATIAGANGPTLAFSPVQAGDAGVYEVFISNSAGNVTSLPAILNVIPRSYAGVYFGTFAGGLGNFALYVREDNTGVFLGYLPGSVAPVMNLNVSVNNSGQFTFFQGNIAASAANDAEPPRAAALAPVNVAGSIANDGTVTGSITGGVNATLSATRASDSGNTQGIAGFYQAGAPGSAASAFTIAGPNNQAFVVVQAGAASDGGLGTVTNAGQVSVITSRSIITETIVPDGSVSGTASGAVTASFSGASDRLLARQRLVNISSRARVGAGETVAIAGFVISGEESKPVLIRAVGPTLGTLGVPGALAAPRLELFRAGNNTAIATNTGIAANRTTIDAASVQAGAFALGTSGADAAILTTLAPGNYTAVVSSTTAATGVALVEVYDLSAAAPGQKLLNISTRASAGTAENTLIAGFVVPPGPAKRVLVRGIGPGLTPFGITGVLPQPTLTLISGSTTVAQNTTWSTSADAAAISAAAVQAGAFGLAAQDAAMVVTLPAGNYTAQVTGAGGASGVALIEVYELP